MPSLVLVVERRDDSFHCSIGFVTNYPIITIPTAWYVDTRKYTVIKKRRIFFGHFSTDLF